MKTPPSSIKKVGNARLYVRKPVQKLTAEHPKVLSLIKKAIENKEITANSFTIISRKPPITIQRAATGYHHTGGVNRNHHLFNKRFGTFRLTISGKSYFLKYSNFIGVDSIERHERARELLTELNHRIGNTNVRLIEPHVLFTSGKKGAFGSNSREGFIVTRFFENHQVSQIPDLNYNAQEPLRRASDTLQGFFKERNISGETRLPNLFYEEKTNTVWIFDL